MKCGVRLARADIVFKLSTKTRADIVFKLSTKKTIKLFLSASGGAASMWFGDSGSLVLLVLWVFICGVVSLSPCGIVTGVYGPITRTSHLKTFSVKARGRR